MASKLFDCLMKNESNLILKGGESHFPSFSHFTQGLFVHSTITKFIEFMVENAHLLDSKSLDAVVLDLCYIPRIKHWSAIDEGREDWEHIRLCIISMNYEENKYESFIVQMQPHGIHHNGMDYFYQRENAVKYNTFLSIVEDLVKMPIEQYTQGTFKYAEIV